MPGAPRSDERREGRTDRVAGRRQRLGGLLTGAVTLLLVDALARYRDPARAGLAAGLLLAARGPLLGRSMHLRNALLAATAGALALLYRALVDPGPGWPDAVLVGALLWLPDPPPAAGTAPEREAVARLVDRTAGDALAPFALRTDKAYAFAADGRSAIGYRVRLGTAVAAGDPVGAPDAAPDAVRRFLDLARDHGWHPAVLGTRDPLLWSAHGLRAVPIGRDVVIDVPDFSLAGRRMRNLRQARARAQRAGVTVEVVPEAELPAPVRQEALAFARSSRAGVDPRGFSMILDHPLDGVHPRAVVSIARDRRGRLVALQRWGAADGGRELSLDIPWRHGAAPNGTDELLTTGVVRWLRARGGRRVSLAFSAFPELTGERSAAAATSLGVVARVLRLFVRALRPVIDLDSLNRYLHKYHAPGPRRYVLLLPWQLPVVLAAMLLLEFSRPAGAPRRGRSSGSGPVPRCRTWSEPAPPTDRVRRAVRPRWPTGCAGRRR